MRWRVISGLLSASSVAAAQPEAPCAADSCLADPPRRPWVLSDDCRDTTDVVGYQHCARFGEWSAAATDTQLVFEVGLGLRRITALRIDRNASARTSVPDAPGDVSDVIATSSFRVTGVKSGVYAGLEVEIGDLSRRAYRYGGVVQTGGVLGVRGSFGRLELGAEAALAERIVRTTDVEHVTPPTMTGPVIELRAKVNVWVSPWLTLGGEFGAGLLDRSEWVGAIMFGFHTRAFGG